MHTFTTGRAALALASLLSLTACGGGGDAPDAAAATQTASTQATAGGNTATASAGTGSANAATAGSGRAQAQAADQPTSRLNAWRLLTQASFGPTEAEVQRVMASGAAAWIDAQMALPPQGSHLARWLSDDARMKALDPKTDGGARAVVSSFYQQALFNPDQLRQRVAFALSEIFVVSTVEMDGAKAMTVAAYQDMLAANAFGNYRTLIEQVARHPAMGLYLSHLKNRKADLSAEREPDQNFARELMQLFSIGLVPLAADGTPRGSGDTYGAADVEGMAAVFTGWSWAGADTSNSRFSAAFNTVGLDATRPMQGYPQFHEPGAKTLLGITVPARDSASPNLSLKLALDRLAADASVGPFIGRQLIQRLVTSEPSPGYVARVSAVWANNGSGVRGDLGAVVRAILLDNEARSSTVAAEAAYGKLREPVLRQTALLRALGVRSDSGLALMELDDDPATGLGQSPLRSPSVFNFFRPRFVPETGRAGELGMTVPEMQTSTEISTAGYVNHLMRLLAAGVGRRGFDGRASRADVQPDIASWRALSGEPAALVDALGLRLFGRATPAALKAVVVPAVQSVRLPVLKADGSNRSIVEAAQARRVQAAALLLAVSPEFIVQR